MSRQIPTRPVIWPSSFFSGNFDVRNLPRAVFASARPRAWVAAAISVVLFLAVARTNFGAPNLYAPQSERNVFIDPAVVVQSDLPLLNEYAAGANPPPGVSALAGRGSDVTVTGTVDDIRPYLWQSAVAVAPLSS